MTKFLDNANAEHDATGFGGYSDQSRVSRRRKVILTIFAVLMTLVAAGCAGGYLYWQSFKGTPQYALAALVDAARRDDQARIDEFVAIDSIVDDFMPQITGKAVELYGRGLPPQTIAKVAQVATPLMPAVKERARARLPIMIRKKTERFESVPFAAMVIGAERYLDIRLSGDTAVVRSKLPQHSFEVRMQRNGGSWKIVGVRDDELATEIAQKIGQEIIAVATHGGVNAAGDRLGLGNLNTILRQAEDIFK
ncbi:MAG: hypothetical protein DMF63_09555 [Acidobacteria bacterium]|nr:MAG: hypothetical protein DMF63_09555 [Acidobacteriota bacterium]